MRELEKKLGMTREQIETSGLNVYTTVNKRLQRIAEETITETVNAGSDIQIGFSAIDPDTGKVLALVGGRNYQKARLTGRHKQSASRLQRSSLYCIIKRSRAGLHP